MICEVLDQSIDAQAIKPLVCEVLDKQLNTEILAPKTPVAQVEVLGGLGLFINLGNVTDVARLSIQNIFQQANTFNGIRFIPKTIFGDYTFLTTDSIIAANASGGSFVALLPSATGSGQLYFVKRTDPTDNVVTLQAQDGDTIDGSISVNLVDQWSDCLVIDAAPGYWAQWGSAGDSTSQATTEVPTGLINGINTVFTTSDAFTSITVYLNGLRQREGADYTITGESEITMNDAPIMGFVSDNLVVEYIS